MTRHQSTKFTYDELNALLVKEFPCLTHKYEQELDWWDDEKPGPHVVYGDQFTPYLVDRLKAGDKEAAKRAFEHLEMLLSHKDVKVQEVAVVTVLEYLESDHELAALARPFLGPQATGAMNDLKKFWDEVRG